MTKKGMCIDLVSHRTQINTDKKIQINTDTLTYKERLLNYKKFAAAFSYPDEEGLRLEYDKMFRAGEVWLYGAEYTAENEFQRANSLADISGFYRAFGLETDRQRPDALTCELEFMHYLLFKEVNAPDADKAKVCLEAQRKFFNEHLEPAAKGIAQAIIANKGHNFYREASQGLLEFLECEKRVIARSPDGGFLARHCERPRAIARGSEAISMTGSEQAPQSKKRGIASSRPSVGARNDGFEI